MIDWIKSLISGLATTILTFAGGIVFGWRKKQVSELKQEVKAHETRDKVEDSIRKSDFAARRLRLKRWAVRGVQDNPPDGKGR